MAVNVGVQESEIIVPGEPSGATGDNSKVSGDTTLASGKNSTASGDNTKASGDNSTASGKQTQALGLNSKASGQSSVAQGVNSSSEGLGTSAVGNNSHAEGELSKSVGVDSHAEGHKTKAEGKASHAEGTLSKAEADFTHAEGVNTLASGLNSHSEGFHTIASGLNSHAEGDNTEASGIDSHAEGDGSVAGGDQSHAEGLNTSTSGIASHAEGNGTTASGNNSHVEGSGGTASGLNSHAQGDSTTASGVASDASGNTTVASGENSHAGGLESEASGAQAFASGTRALSEGVDSHSLGFGTRATGDGSFSGGQGDFAGQQIDYTSRTNKKGLICFQEQQFFIDDDNWLYARGENSKGQLGLGHSNDVAEFTAVGIQVRQIASCYYGWSTFVIGLDNKLYGAGDTGFYSNDALGNGRVFTGALNSTTFIQSDFASPIKNLGGSFYGVFITTEDDQLWSSGNWGYLMNDNAYNTNTFRQVTGQTAKLLWPYNNYNFFAAWVDSSDTMWTTGPSGMGIIIGDSSGFDRGPTTTGEQVSDFWLLQGAFFACKTLDGRWLAAGNDPRVYSNWDFFDGQVPFFISTYDFVEFTFPANMQIDSLFGTDYDFAPYSSATKTVYLDRDMEWQAGYTTYGVQLAGYVAIPDVVNLQDTMETIAITKTDKISYDVCDWAVPAFGYPTAYDTWTQMHASLPTTTLNEIPLIGDVLPNSSGDASFSYGVRTRANGIGSHAIGFETIADGNNSHAEGENTVETSEKIVISLDNLYKYETSAPSTTGGNYQVLSPSDIEANDYFGDEDAVAVSGTHILVGSRLEDDGVTSDMGAAYIFNIDGSGEIKLTASDREGFDIFGGSVALSDTKAYVGAEGANVDALNRGAVYIYNLDGSGEVILNPGDASATSTSFGCKLGMNPSQTKLFVGDKSASVGKGAVYIYDPDGTNELMVTASDGALSDQFGDALDASDTHFVVGADGVDTLNSGVGQAYIYNIDGTGEIILTDPNDIANDKFGDAVAINDTHVFIGCPGADGSGAVYIYQINGTFVSKVVPASRTAGDNFGTSVVVTTNKLIVGAPGTDGVEGTSLGSVHVFDIDGTNEIVVTPPTRVASQFFGVGVATNGEKVFTSIYDSTIASFGGSVGIFDAGENVITSSGLRTFIP